MKNIDNNKLFDFGRISLDYAKYRDIYPPIFYEKILSRNLCTANQTVLDIGTGTGVLPRNMYQHGAKWIGADISENQVEQAKLLSSGMNIEYTVMSAENLVFPPKTFDLITACQCHWYFNHKKIVPLLNKILKTNGRLLFLTMDWLPFEDKIARLSENLVLKYNPEWSGGNRSFSPICIPECYSEYFEVVYHEEYRVKVPFTRETWNGRMKSCRGIGASLSEKKISHWEKEHFKLLNEVAPKKFEVLHCVAMLELKKFTEMLDKL